MVVGALAALGFAADCDCLRAGTESFAGADADGDVAAYAGTDRYRDCDPDKGTYRSTHLYGNAHADYDAESDLSADAHPDGSGDPDPGTNGHTHARADLHTESHGNLHTESHGDSDQEHPAYGNSGACFCGLARGILWQPRPGRRAGIGPDG
jgi:hypothetical protein